MKRAAFFMLSLLLVSSCNKEDSSDVNQDKIYTDYEIFYNQNEDKTHAVARFRFGGATGTLLELTDETGADVKFNGTVMPYNNWYGGHHLEFAGRLESGSFTYTNTEGSTYTNSIPQGDTIAFPIDFDTIIKSQANTLTWVGSALGADQHVGIFVGTPTWGQDALFLQAQEGATNLVMGVNQMANLATGAANVYMDRSTAVNVTQGTSEGGRMRYRYRCTNQSVMVIE